MKFEDIYQFFQEPPPIYLNKELTVCYVLSVLVQGDSYGTELIQNLESEYSEYRLSDTVLYSALKFLESENAIKGYWKKVEGRGRPRRMYQVRPECLPQAQELARLWRSYAKTSPGAPQPLIPPNPSFKGGQGGIPITGESF
ncbi:MAG TPA: helix-turn-helix transcriptional regulator [Oscillatoriaceae cyanobacterium M33_DOE_052]|uniref:PadR family transcriptional regulator n=1 Tax=Planktothricoides sp. SpSt-374 TaxID=2282167 RepID=A0A7C3ZI20_9CYAN|nr:helix-turn-helix transcriptional regulator [Oscillatoriaceae cyanobacterium M33_DOE_052]